MDQVIIQHRFTIVKDGISLTDALVLPKADYEALSSEQIETLKEERFQNHKDRIENPPVIPEPTKEEQLASIEKDLASIEEQRVALTSLKTELEKPSKDLGGK